jgi:long-chain acyl-CoA synthetase
LHYQESGEWRHVTWGEVSQQSHSLSKVLASKGIKSGDRILVIADNSRDWLISELAILRLKAILVAGYSNSRLDEWRHILQDSGALILIADHHLSEEMGILAKEFKDQLCHSFYIGSGEWEESLSQNAGGIKTQESIDDLDQTVCLIYTSGTGGAPKGVILSNRNILNNCCGAAKTIEPYGLTGNRFLSILPFAHSYAHCADIWTPIYIGAQIFLSGDLKNLNANLQFARPTIMNTIPRLWDVLRKQIIAHMNAQGFLSKYLFSLTLRLGKKKIDGKNLTLMEVLQNQICEFLVRKKIKVKLGGHLVGAVVAGSPLTEEDAIFFGALGIKLHQAYGQTECGPGITMSEEGELIPGTVGRPMVGMEVRLAEDGEILVRGPNLMKGYWNDPDLTAKTIIDGWLHTGDIGSWDQKGLLQILDRKKDFIKTSGSEMISPQSIETKFNTFPDIDRVVIYGHGKLFLVAVVIPTVENINALKSQKIDLQSLEKRIDEDIKTVNKTLDSKYRIKKFVVIPEELSIQKGTITPSLKVKRNRLYELHSKEIEQLYIS